MNDKCRHLFILEADKVRQRVHLLSHLLLVVQHVVQVFVLHDQGHALEPGGDVGLGDLRHICVEKRGGISFQVGHRRHKPRPEAEEVIDA